MNLGGYLFSLHHLLIGVVSRWVLPVIRNSQFHFRLALKFQLLRRKKMHTLISFWTPPISNILLNIQCFSSFYTVGSE